MSNAISLGRTGRAGKLGTAITFLTNDDDEVMYELKNGTFLSLLSLMLSVRCLLELTTSVMHAPEIAKSPVSKVPPELARHESAQQKVTRDMKRKREADDQG